MSEPVLTTRQKLRAVIDLEVARLHEKTRLGHGLDKIEIIELGALIRAVGLDPEKTSDLVDDDGQTDEELLQLAGSG